MKLTPEEQALILKHRKDAEAAKAKAWQPKPLDSYSDEEKAKHFDSFYAAALEEFRRIEEERSIEDSDFDHYMGDAVMRLLGKDVFDSCINKWV